MAIDDVADVGGVDAFDVFENIDLVLGVGQVQGVRQRGVKENARDGGVVIQRVNLTVELFASGGGGEGAQFVRYAELGAGPLLILGINAGGAVFAHQQCDEAHGFAELLKCRNASRDLVADLGGEGFTVNQLRGHYIHHGDTREKSNRGVKRNVTSPEFANFKQ